MSSDSVKACSVVKPAYSSRLMRFAGTESIADSSIPGGRGSIIPTCVGRFFPGTVCWARCEKSDHYELNLMSVQSNVTYFAEKGVRPANEAN